MRTGNRFVFSKVVVRVFIGILVVISIYPLLWMFISSFKTNAEFTMNRFGLPRQFTFVNYVEAWKQGNFAGFFVNSGIVTALSLFLMIGSASMTAFTFIRYRFRISRAMLAYFVIGQMLSAQVVLIAVYLLMVILKLADSLPGLSLVYAASGLPFAIFLLQGFFRTLPLELFEAAEIDGYNDWAIFASIALPLVAPGLATAFIIQFLYVWNEFPLALIVISTVEKTTLPVGIYRVVRDMSYSNYAKACAGLSITALPVLVIYLIFQKKIIAGMTAGAIKG
jgi:multiple sugar transport system permease protein/raffinose/stachyose/melibiose transport system permease protein/N-acetylglucosamine transport system permease protein